MANKGKKIYLIKENGIIKEVTQKEYSEYAKGKPLLCPDCKLSNCAKYQREYSQNHFETCDIFTDGSYKASIKQKVEKYTDKYGIEREVEVLHEDEIYFNVYKCNQYHVQKEIIDNEQNKIKEQILQKEKKVKSLIESIISCKTEDDKDELRNEVIRIKDEIDTLESQITLPNVMKDLLQARKDKLIEYTTKSAIDRHNQIYEEEESIDEIRRFTKQKESQISKIMLQYSNRENSK